MIYHLDITASTNDDARDDKYREGDVVWADFQTAGRGQRGHIWHSQKGENLTFSVVLEPTFVPIAEQFSVSEIVALSLVDMLAEYGIEAKIKWTNDIYVGDKKLVGILIEHSLASTTLRRTIVGVGVNVNQTEFDSSIPNPVSMAQLLGRQLDIEEVLKCFLDHLQRNYNTLREGAEEVLHERYNSQLYRKGEWHTYACPSGEKFQAKIVGTAPSGALCLENKDGETKDYLFKEVEFVIF
jgi:BirA family biotin operon repressor/biotin-[acetyl-CoA-carboxylase] ligase